MKALTSRRFWWLVALLGFVSLGPLARAHPESIGNWMSNFATALGVTGDDLPMQGEIVDEFSAVVADPAPLAKFGLPGVVTGDNLQLHNHENGYWTITNMRTQRHLKIALAWLIRFGATPDHELADGEPPEQMTGIVVTPLILARSGFMTAGSAKRFRLDYGNAAWTLTLEPSGESRKVPF